MSTFNSSFSSLPDLLYYRATQSSGLKGFNVNEKFYLWSWLWKTSQNFASNLINGNVKIGERVILIVPNSADFLIAFYGTILCGAIAVPVFSNSSTDRCFQIMKLCGSKNIIIPENIQSNRKNEFESWAKDHNISIHWVNENPKPSIQTCLPKVHADDIAFIQYTSGSTDFPKGIPLSHRNLLINIGQMTEAMNITSDDVFVSWLPVYHDMGLILNTMVPLYASAHLVLMAEGLHRIHSWLKTIEQYKGTFISAPDIAYRLCVKGVRCHSDYDLSSLRVALNASEPIHFQTYKMFEDAFKLKNVMISGYGLAEATVAVTMHPPSKPPKIDANNYVSSGRPLRGIEVKIENKNQSDDSAGEILVKSPALMTGYFDVQEKPGLFDKDAFLHTGDIGYIDSEGYLFVLARKKNIIKQAGHTLYPDDIEEVVKFSEDVRQAAAIGIDRLKDGGESLVVFVEIKNFECHSSDFCHELVVKIVNNIYSHFGIRPGKVFLVKPKTLPRTPNGKLKHSVLKNLYLYHPEELKNWIVYPEI